MYLTATQDALRKNGLWNRISLELGGDLRGHFFGVDLFDAAYWSHVSIRLVLDGFQIFVPLLNHVLLLLLLLLLLLRLRLWLLLLLLLLLLLVLRDS